MEQPAREIWRRIRDFELDDPTATLCFSDRLARENGWSKEFSLRVIEEYKKFIFLVHMTGEPLTPSDQVDQAWHLHLIYTRSYWIELCGGVLQQELHHGPTLGGEQEQAKFTDWYGRTMHFYRVHFGAEPPPDIWPEHKQRFASTRFQRVDVSRNLVIPIPFRR